MVSLGGTWTIFDEKAKADNPESSSLVYNFYAQKVFLVMRLDSVLPRPGVRVTLDGEKVDSQVAGKDVVDGEVTVDADRLYELINLKGKTENHMLKLEFLTPGIEVFAFTFG